MTLENLGDHVRGVRKKKGLSQEAVARRADLSLNVIARIELGIITNPHYLTLASIARALGMTVTELVEEPPELLREPVPLDEASQKTGPADTTKVPDPDVWGEDKDRPQPPIPESTGKHIGVRVGRDEHEISWYLDLMRKTKQGEITREDAEKRFADHVSSWEGGAA